MAPRLRISDTNTAGPVHRERGRGGVGDDLAGVAAARAAFDAEVAGRVRKWYQLLQVRARGPGPCVHVGL